MIIYTVFQTQTAVFALTDDANSTKSTCDAKHSMLILNFGEAHAFSMSFSKIEEVYEADVVTFTYNLGDPVHFPNSKSKGNVYISMCIYFLKNLAIDLLADFLDFSGFVRTYCGKRAS